VKKEKEGGAYIDAKSRDGSPCSYSRYNSGSGHSTNGLQERLTTEKRLMKKQLLSFWIIFTALGLVGCTMTLGTVALRPFVSPHVEVEAAILCFVFAASGVVLLCYLATKIGKVAKHVGATEEKEK